MLRVKIFPKCPTCNREFRPGQTWMRANYCRAAFLLAFLAEHPSLSGWELSKETDMPYGQVLTALQKLRDWNLVDLAEEPREAGGIRYLYTPIPGWESTVGEWQAKDSPL